MAYTEIKFTNADKSKIAPIGYSWTCLFFGFFVPLLRGHISGFFIWFIIAIITANLAWWLVMPFIYNKQYVKYLIINGFKSEGPTDHINSISTKLGFQIP